MDFGNDIIAMISQVEKNMAIYRHIKENTKKAKHTNKSSWEKKTAAASRIRVPAPSMNKPPTPFDEEH